MHWLAGVDWPASSLRTAAASHSRASSAIEFGCTRVSRTRLRPWLAPGVKALPVQAFHLQRAEQRLAAGVVPAVAAAAHRCRDAVLGQHVAQVLAGVLAAPPSSTDIRVSH